MKKIYLVILLLALIQAAHGQIFHPVKWSYGFKKLSSTEVVVMLKADIEPGWHIYSINQPDGGPVKTSFTFAASAVYSLASTVSEPLPVTKYEKAFGINVAYFENSVVFRQRIHVNTLPAVISGTLRYMVCNDERCLPPETVSFNVAVKDK